MSDATGVLAVHSVHLSTGKLLMWDGRHDQHAWDIETNTSEWYPLTSQGGYEDCYIDLGEDPTTPPLAIDLFCAGHVLDDAGNLVAAGANLTGTNSGGKHLCPPLAVLGAGRQWCRRRG